MTILWIYNRPLIPEAGGTERITSILMRGFSSRGYNCLGMLVVHQEDLSLSYNGEPVDDLYRFLKDNHVDVVINQEALTTCVLNTFLDKGGDLWHKEGGKLITCLHFDPEGPGTIYFFKIKKNKTLHDWFTILKLSMFKTFYKHKQDKDTGIVYRELYDKSDYFIALSHTHFPYLQKVMNMVTPKISHYNKLVAINNPLTFEDVSSPSILKEKKKVCLIVARMDEYYKRISLSLKAWQKVQQHLETRDWVLKVVGDGPSLNDYKEYVNNHKIPNVEFCGRQNPELYYREAKIFLMTSSREGWGLTLTESFQRGVVPIAMDSSPVFRQIITNGEDGYICPNNDIKTLSQLIVALIKNPTQLETMAKCALCSAEKFNLDNAMNAWGNLFK